MMRIPRSAGIAGAVVVMVGLAGCSPAGGEQIIYDVIASSAGADVTYAETADGVEPLQIEEHLTESSWTMSPELNPATTTPYLSVKPPPGGAARCRIMLLKGNDLTVVADEIGQIGTEIECVYKR